MHCPQSKGRSMAAAVERFPQLLLAMLLLTALSPACYGLPSQPGPGGSAGASTGTARARASAHAEDTESNSGQWAVAARARARAGSSAARGRPRSGAPALSAGQPGLGPSGQAKPSTLEVRARQTRPSEERHCVRPVVPVVPAERLLALSRHCVRLPETCWQRALFLRFVFQSAISSPWSRHRIAAAKATCQPRQAKEGGPKFKNSANTIRISCLPRRAPGQLLRRARQLQRG